MIVKSSKPHYHIAVPKHTKDQAARFYALCKDLEHDAIEAKERACKKFQVSCFNSLTEVQMDWLNKTLVMQYNKRIEQL